MVRTLIVLNLFHFLYITCIKGEIILINLVLGDN